MRKTLTHVFMSGVLALGLVLGIATSQAVAAPAMNAEKDFSGNVWLSSTLSEQTAFLYGVNCAVAIENHIAQRAGKTPSPFVNDWTNAFRDTQPEVLSLHITEWLHSHPQDADKNIFDIIWTQFVVQKTKQ